jgi:hypothetical protein
MTVPSSRQPNVEPCLQDQTRIALNLFNTILQTTTNRDELERSWTAIERDISIQEQQKARQRQLRNRICSDLSLIPYFQIFLLKLFTDALTVYFIALKHKLRNNNGHEASFVFSCILLVCLDKTLQCVPSCHNDSIVQMSSLFPFIVLSFEISLDEILYD